MPVHEFEAIAEPEPQGGFSVFASHYPEVATQGETLDEAWDNVTEAFAVLLDVASEKGQPLKSTTWARASSPHAVRKWIYFRHD